MAAQTPWEVRVDREVFRYLDVGHAYRIDVPLSDPADLGRLSLVEIAANYLRNSVDVVLEGRIRRPEDVVRAHVGPELDGPQLPLIPSTNAAARSEGFRDGPVGAYLEHQTKVLQL